MTWHYIFAKNSHRLLKYQRLTAHIHPATVEDQSRFRQLVARAGCSSSALLGGGQARRVRHAQGPLFCGVKERNVLFIFDGAETGGAEGEWRVDLNWSRRAPSPASACRPASVIRTRTTLIG
jgi:hypothetical protein